MTWRDRAVKAFANASSVSGVIPRRRARRSKASGNWTTFSIPKPYHKPESAPMTTKLSAHFALEELTVSAAGARLGLSNIPTGQNLATLTATAQRMEDVRTLLGGKPIIVLSGFRSAAVNKAVGGASNSAHMSGNAVDFICPGFGSPAKVAAHLAKHLTGYDQIIEEFNQWVHVGFGPGKRGQKLTARKVNGRTKYTVGIAG